MSITKTQGRKLKAAAVAVKCACGCDSVLTPDDIGAVCDHCNAAVGLMCDMPDENGEPTRWLCRHSCGGTWQSVAGAPA